MARIPEKEIGRLKSEISLQRLAEAKGVVLRKRGDELMGLCPFHEDHSPSLVINSSKNVWHCLGACQTGGTVIDWVMKAEGVSFRHAVEILRKEFSPLAAAAAVSQKVSNVAPLTEMKRVISEDADDQQRLRQVLNYYTATRMGVPSLYLPWETQLSFVPWMILPYMSIDVLFVLAFFLCRDRQTLRTLAAQLSFAILVSCSLFLLVPQRCRRRTPNRR